MAWKKMFFVPIIIAIWVAGFFVLPAPSFPAEEKNISPLIVIMREVNAVQLLVKKKLKKKIAKKIED